MSEETITQDQWSGPDKGGESGSGFIEAFACHLAERLGTWLS